MNITRMGKLGWKVFLSNFNMLKYPYKLTFAVTYKCNSRCIQCNIWKKKPQNELSLNEIEEFAKKSDFFSWYNITGGEPFLRKDIVEIIDAFLRNSKDFYLLNTTTNSFNPEFIYEKVREILSLRPPRFILTISLDGYRELHEMIRGVPGSFDKALELFKMMRELSREYKNFDTFLGYTSSPFNMGKFKTTYFAVKEIIPNIRPKDFHVNLFHHSGHYYGNLEDNTNINGYNKKVLEELRIVEKMKGNGWLNPVTFLEEIYVKLAKKFIKEGRTPLMCKALQTSFFLDSFGNIFPCTIYSKNLGNIRDYNYDVRKIVDSKFSKRLKKEIMMLKCPNCWTPCEAYQTILGNIFNIIY